MSETADGNPEPEPVELLDPVTSRLQGVTAHGNLTFDVPIMSWIEGDLWQGACGPDLLLPSFEAWLRAFQPGPGPARHQIG